MELQLQRRDSFGSSKMQHLRKQGFVPGVVYAGGEEAQGVLVSEHDFLITVDRLKKNRVYDVKSDDKGLNGSKVIVRDVQTEAIKGKLLHIDFVGVASDREIRVDVPLKLTGTPETVKSGTGILQQSLYFLNVKSLPSDIPEQVEVDVSKMDNGDSILAGRVELPQGVSLQTSKSTAIASLIGRAKRLAENEAALAGAGQAADAAGSDEASAAAEGAEAKSEA